MLHIVGFGAKPPPKTKTVGKWYPDISSLKVEPSDMIIVNLLKADGVDELDYLKDVVDSIGQTGGVLVLVAAPVVVVSHDATNYYFLPWPEYALKGIRNARTTNIHVPSDAPELAKDFGSCFRGKLSAPVTFSSLVGGSQILMESGGDTVSLIHKHGEGSILILPSLESVLLGETTRKAQELLASYLECIQSRILVNFGEVTEEYPAWLDSINVRNESELRKGYDELGCELKQLKEEKSILAATGVPLTRKVASLLDLLGFHVEEMESVGRQDIEVTDGDFRAVVECGGVKGYFDLDKVRQLLEYVAVEGGKGLLIGNPWYEKHPAQRDLPRAFTVAAIERAQKLGICLITVPHLYGAYLDAGSDQQKKKQVRESLKHCTGLWQCTAHDWL